MHMIVWLVSTYSMCIVREIADKIISANHNYVPICLFSQLLCLGLTHKHVMVTCDGILCS